MKYEIRLRKKWNRSYKIEIIQVVYQNTLGYVKIHILYKL